MEASPKMATSPREEESKKERKKEKKRKKERRSYLVKIECVVVLADIHTDRHGHHNFPLPHRGRSK